MPTPMIRRLSDAVVDAGGRAYLVGGAVRAMTMGLPTRDYDVEVFGLSLNQLRLILGRFGPVNEVGRAFSVFKLGNLDVSLPRRDSKTGPGHTGFAIESDPDMTIEDAARRRDFTVNAMSIDLETAARIDPYGGAWDVQSKILRAVDPTTFVDDPLRVLRAMQFGARLGFTVAPATVRLCRDIRHQLRELPAERIWGEMEKLLLSPRPGHGLWIGWDLGAIETLFPELASLVGCQQDPQWHPEGDVWTHTLQALDIAAELAADLPTPRRLAVLLGTLCHDLGKPGTTEFRDGHVRSHAHDEAGVDPTRRLLDRLNVHSIDGYNVRGQVLALVAQHLKPGMFYTAPSVSDGAFRRLACKVDFDLLQRVARADSLGRVVSGRPSVKPVPAVDWFMARASTLRVTHTGPDPLLKGRHLIALGLSPCPEFGRLLARAFEAQLDGTITTTDEAIALVRGWLTPPQTEPTS